MNALAGIPGDPDAIDANTAAMQAVARAMTDAARKLRGLTSNTAYASQAVDAADKNAHRVAGDLDDSAGRYQRTADALGEFSHVLRHAQQQAGAARRHADELNISHARSSVYELAHQYRAASQDAGVSTLARDAAHHDLLVAQHHLAAQEQALHYLRQQAVAAQEEVNAAAAIAIGKIEDAVKSSKLNDNIGYDLGSDAHRAYKDVKRWYDRDVAPLLNALADLAGNLAQALSIVGIVVAFIPGLQFLAGGLELLSTALSALQFAVKVLDFMMGDLTFVGLLAATITFVVAVVTTKAGGAAAKGLARVAERSPVGRGIEDAVTKYGRANRTFERAFDKNAVVTKWMHTVARFDNAHPRVDLGEGVHEAGKYLVEQAGDYDTRQLENAIDGRPTAMPDASNLAPTGIRADVREVRAALHLVPAGAS